jgi:hypothetical protein
MWQDKDVVPRCGEKLQDDFTNIWRRKRKRGRRVAAVKVNCNPRRAGSQEGKR